MSKIKELFEDDKTIYVFDVDGVLCKIEFGDYNHYAFSDEKWAEEIIKDNLYLNEKPIKVMQEFINQLNINNVYVVTKVMNKEEYLDKIEFLNKYYHILKEHIYSTYSKEDKLNKLNEIKKNYPNIDDKYIVMIDDDVDVLNNIMDNSNYSTVHISSFLK